VADDFLLFAEEIERQIELYREGACSVTFNQGLLRSCVSRAYYASFLYARRITSIERTMLKKGENVHIKVIEKLREMNMPIADLLYRLRKKRNRADYSLVFTTRPKDAIWAVKTAKRIVQIIKNSYSNVLKQNKFT